MSKPKKTEPVADMPAWAAKFTRDYIDSGDLLKALEAQKLTPSDFYDAKKAFPRFAEDMKSVVRRANETLRLKALGLALSGSDKLLGLALKTIEDDDDDPSRLTDEQLHRRITGLVSRIRERALALGAIEADLTPAPAAQVTP